MDGFASRKSRRCMSVPCAYILANLEYPSTPEYLEWRCMSAPCVGVPEYTPEYLEYCKRSTEVLRDYCLYATDVVFSL
jgi:hypothetical protein